MSETPPQTLDEWIESRDKRKDLRAQIKIHIEYMTRGLQFIENDQALLVRLCMVAVREYEN